MIVQNHSKYGQFAAEIERLLAVGDSRLKEKVGSHWVRAIGLKKKNGSFCDSGAENEGLRPNSPTSHLKMGVTPPPPGFNYAT